MRVISALELFATCRARLQSAFAAGITLLMALGFVAIAMPAHADQAIPVRNFLDSLGIGVSFNDTRDLLGKLQYLGVHNIRTGYVDGSETAVQQLARGGIRFDFLTDGSRIDIAQLIRGAKLAISYAGYGVAQIEGLNEINNFGFCYQSTCASGGADPNTAPLARKYRQDLYAAVQADATLMANGVVVFDLTGGPETVNAEVNCVLDITNCAGTAPEANAANQHPYIDASLPNAGDSRSIYDALAGTAAQPSAICSEYTIGCARGNVWNPGSVVTETGQQACIPGYGACTGGVNQRVQAILNINFWLSAFAVGIPRTYIYKLIDDWWEGYGFYGCDIATNCTMPFPKRIATVTHNLTTILNDSGGRTDVLNYVLSGMPAHGHALLLEKSTGAFNLFLWNEAQVWNGSSDVSVTPVSVTVDLGATYSRVQVFNPYISTSAQATYRGIHSLTVSLGSEAQIIEITP